MLVAGGRDHSTVGNLLIAVGAIGITGVAVLGAGGILGIPNLGMLMAGGRDDAALGNQSAAGLAVGVAGIAVLGAGGILSVPNLGVGMEGHIRINGGVGRSVVPLQELHAEGGRSVHGGGVLHGEGQGSQIAACGLAGGVHITQGHGAVRILVGGVLGGDGHVGQLELGGVVADGEQAVGGLALAHVGHGQGQGLFILGQGRLGLGLGSCGSLTVGGGGGSVQAAGGRSGSGLSGAEVLFGSNFVPGDHVGHGIQSGKSVAVSGLLGLTAQNDGRRPDVLTEGADLGSDPLAVIAQHHPIDVVGLAGEGGQVQHQVIALGGKDHGGVSAFVLVDAELHTQLGQVGGKVAEFCAVALVGGVDLIHPDIARIVQDQYPLGRTAVDGAAAGGDQGSQIRGTGVLSHVLLHVEGRISQSRGRIGGQQEVSVDGEHLGIVIGGEHIAVLHIPDGHLGGIGVGGDVLTGGHVHLVDLEGRSAVADPQVVIHIHGGGNGAAGFQVVVVGPGVVLGHIPLVDHGIALGILQGTVDQGVHIGNRNGAGSGLGGVLIRGSRDDGRAFSDGGHQAVVGNGSHGIIAGGPGHGVGLHAEGLHGSGQLGGVLLVQGQAGSIELHAHVAAQLVRVQVDLVGGDVVGIVGHLHQDVLGITQLGGIQFNGSLAAQLCALGRTCGASQDGLLVVVNQEGCRHIAVIGSLDGDLPVGHGHAGNGGSGLIHVSAVRAGGTGAQGIPVNGLGRVVHVVFRSLGQGDRDLAALGSIGRRKAQAQTVLNIPPGRAVGIIVSAVIGADGALLQIGLAGIIGNGHTGSRCVPDQGVVEAVEGGGLRVEGIPGGIVILVHIGVAAEVILAAVTLVVHRHHLEVDGLLVGVQVRRTLLLTGQVIITGAHVIHGSVGPVAVVAQHGDGVGSTGDALGRAHLIGIHIAFHVSAGTAAEFVHIVHGILVQRHGQAHMNGAVGGDLHAALAHLAIEQVNIEGIHIAVLIQVGCIGMGNGIPHAGHIVQQGLAVGQGDGTVAVKVAVLQAFGALGFNMLAVHDPAQRRADDGRPVRLEVHTALLCQGLREEVGGKGKVAGGVLQVVDGKAEGVGTGAVGIVAQLHLHLAVSIGVGGIGVHGNVAAGVDGIAHIGKTGALLQHGVVILIGGQRSSGGHQQTLGQEPHRAAGFLVQLVSLDVLSQHGGHTGDLGSGHGGTGHILVAAAIHQGVDVAAGSGDLRLHGQGTGHAPGREAAHGVVVAVVSLGGSAAADGDLTGVVEDLAGAVLDGRGVLLQEIGIVQGDGHGGLGLGVVRQVHIDFALGVVGDNGGNGSCGHGVLGLHIEGDGATVADGNLSGQNVLHGLEVFRRTGRVHVNELMLPCDGGDGGILVVVGAGVGIEDLVVVGFHVGIGDTVVVHGGHGQGIGVGSGGAAGGPAVAVGISHAVGRVLVPAAGVTGGDGDHHAALGDPLQDGCIGVGGNVVEAGVAGAQGQVGGIGTQHHGVLDGHHVVGVISAAGLAEDLHDQDLCVGSHALGADGVQGIGVAALAIGNKAVARGDAGDVGAVVTLGILVMGDVQAVVHVVEAEGDLGVHIQGGSSQTVVTLVSIQGGQLIGDVLGGHQLGAGVLHGVLESAGIQGRMVGVGTGIDDGHLAACTGVTGGPGGGGADHGIGGGHVGIGSIGGSSAGLITGLDEHFLDAGQGLDLLNVAVGHIGRDDVGGQGQIPDHIQFFPVQSLLGNGLFHALLLGFQGGTVAHGTGIGGSHLCCAETLFQSGGGVQNDGHTDHIRGRIF